MKNSLPTLQKYFLVFLFSLASGLGWGQVIGSFPNISDGFEGRTMGSVTSSLNQGTQYSDWVLNNSSSAAASILTTGGRSGNYYVNYSSTSTATRRISSPTVQATNSGGFQVSTSYVIQFYYKTTGVSNFGTGINLDGTTNWGTTETVSTLSSTSGNWTKRTVVLTTNAGTSPTGISATSSRYGHIQFRSNASMGTGSSIDIDDVVVYQAGAADVAAPNSPGAVSVSNPSLTGLDIAWGAATGGVDGGGYVVVRYAVSPNADNDPNQNGIYAVGNTTTNGTGSLTGTIRYVGTGTSFTDSGLSSGTTYYYKVYTVDKAFNYSAESNGNGTTLSSTPVPEINIQGNSVNILDGNTAYSTTDNTDFGSTIINGTISKTFTIQNTGTASLNVTGINVVGSNGFSITSPSSFPFSIAASSSANFTVQFSNTTANTFTETVNVLSDDSDEGTYDFKVKALVNAPILTATPTTLSGFTYVQGAGPSSSQSFIISGSNLSPASGNITVNGSTNYLVSTDNSTFVASVTIPYTSSSVSSTIYVRLKAGLSVGTYNSEYISISGGSASSSSVTCNGDVTMLTYNTVQIGDWDTASTWNYGVPPSGAIININHAVTLGRSINNSGSINVNNGGSIQLNSGGYINGNNVVYAATGTGLIINNTSTYGVSSGQTFWPTTNPPYNVTISGTAANTGADINMIVGDVNGILTLNNKLNINTANAIKVNGTLLINNGGYVETNSPVYGSASTLVYNTGYGVYKEWTGTGTTAGTGIPQDVMVQNNSTVNVSTGSARGLAGNLTITNGSTFNTSDVLNVTGNVTNSGIFNSNNITNISGNLTTSNSLSLGNDLYLAGNWTNSGTFTPNSKAVFYNGATSQTINNTSGETFAYLVHNGNSTLQLNNDVTVNGGSGDVLQLLAGNFDLNGKKLTLSGTGGLGNIKIGGNQTLNSSVSGAIFNITNSLKTVTSGNLTIANNVTTVLNQGIDFGNNLTTIDGVLRISTGGYVQNNSPIYTSNSTLDYNGVSDYGVGKEWSGSATTIGNGVPNTVTLTGNSVIKMPDVASSSRSASYINIGVGSTLNQAATQNFADIIVFGNGAAWTNNGTINANNRTIIFQGSSPQTINGSNGNFGNLKINNSAGVTTNVNLNITNALDLTLGKLFIGTYNVSTGTTTNSSSNSYVVTASSGRLIQNVPASDVYFPIGFTDTNYTPIKINNTSGSSNIGALVKQSITNAVNDATKVVTLEWSLNSDAATTATITPVWVAAKPINEATNFTDTGIGELGNYTTSYTVYPVNLVTNTTTATGVSLRNGSNLIVVGNTSAVLASANSHLLVDPAFVYPTNIPYINYIGTDVTTSNSIEVGRFIIYDGDPATGDADSLPTVLNSLTLAVTGSTYIERVALYDTATNNEIAEIAGGSTPISFSNSSFPGFNISVPDNSSKTFSIRVTFKTAVTDNQQIRFSVNIRTSAAGNSQFVSSEVTTQQTSINGDDNRIEVIADRLAFVQQPTNTIVNGTMAPAVTVQSEDLYHNKDLDYSTSTQITSTGTLTGTPVNTTTISGLATFSSLVHTVIGTGLTFSASSGTLIGATSNTFDITSYASGDFKTITGSGLLWSTAAHWQKFDGSTWGIAGADGTPSNTSNVYIFGTMSTNGSRTANKITIENGGNLTISAASTATNGTVIKSGGILNLDAAYTNGTSNGSTAVFEIESTAKLVINYSTATSTAAIWNGVENFKNGSIVEIKNWNYGAGSGANRLIYDDTRITRNVDGYAFGNLIISGTPTTLFTMVYTTNTTNVKLCQNDFSFNSATIDKNVTFISNATASVTIGGSIISNNGTISISVSTGSSGSDVFPIINVLGDLKIQGGNIDLNQNSSAFSYTTLNLSGNIYANSGNVLFSTDTTGSILNLLGLTTQTIDIASTGANENKNITFNVKNGAYVQLANNNFDFNTTTLNVESGGTFDAGNDFQITGASGTNAINITGLFKTNDADGFNGGTGTSVKSGVTISLANGSTVEYTKAGNQTITEFNPLPATPSISDYTTKGYYNLKITGDNGVGTGTVTSKTVATNGVYVRNDLLISDSKSILKIDANKSINVYNNVTNSGNETNFIVESDGSLIQSKNTSTNGNTGKITSRRNAQLKRLDYNYWGSPVANQMLKAFSPGTLNSRFYTYKEDNDTFVVVPSPATTPFALAKGYAIRASNTAPSTVQTFAGEFKGIPNNGIVSINLDYSGTGNGYNLVANPYPSNMDLDKLYTDNNTDITGTYYFWTNINPNPVMQSSNYPTDGYYNNYAIYNASGGTPATAPATCEDDCVADSETPTNIIKPGQGFIVKTTGASKVLDFNNAQRTNNTSGYFFNKNGTENSVDRYWLQLMTPIQLVNTILVAYKEGSSKAFEGNFDAKLLVDAPDSFYTKLDNSKYSIQGRGYPLDLEDKVDLGVSFHQSGTHIISIPRKEGVFANGQPVYLHDKLLDIYTDLTQNVYTFNTDAGNFADRFEITYKPAGPLSTEDELTKEIVVYTNGLDYVIESPKKLLEVKLLDISGKLISTAMPNKNTLLINNTNLAKGVYVLQIKTSSGITMKKVIK